MKFKTLLLIALSLTAGNCFSVTNEGRRFWIAYMENLTLTMNGKPQFTLVVSSKRNCTGKIIFPAKGIEIPFSVKGNTPQLIHLPDVILYADGADVKSDKGILVTTTEDVELIAYHYRAYFSEASRILPEQLLDNKYTLVCARDVDGSSPSSFVVVSSTNDNIIQIIPSVFTDGFRSPGVPFIVRLNIGETFQVQANEDLSGTKILSSGPVAVFGGARQGNISANDCQSSPIADNHLYEQILPDKYLGKHYFLVPLQGQGILPVTVVAIDNNTRLQTPDGEINLDAGGVHKFYVSEASEIRSDKPVNVMCFNKSLSCNESNLGDPSQMMVMPAECESKKQVIYAPDNKSLAGTNYFDVHYVNLVCKARYGSFVYIDNAKVNFTTFPQNPLYAYAQVKVDPGFHTITSDSGGFHGTAYGFGYFDAYSYALGYTFPEETTPLMKVVLVNNPVTTNDMKIRYEFPDSNTYETHFDIYDALGREIFSQSKQVNLLDPVIHCNITYLSAATYFLRVKVNGDVMLVQPFIKL